MIPFANAFLRDDHEVLVAAPRPPAAMIADAGLDHHPIPDPPPTSAASRSSTEPAR